MSGLATWLSHPRIVVFVRMNMRTGGTQSSLHMSSHSLVEMPALWFPLGTLIRVVYRITGQIFEEDNKSTHSLGFSENRCSSISVKISKLRSSSSTKMA